MPLKKIIRNIPHKRRTTVSNQRMVYQEYKKTADEAEKAAKALEKKDLKTAIESAGNAAKNAGNTVKKLVQCGAEKVVDFFKNLF